MGVSGVNSLPHSVRGIALFWSLFYDGRFVSYDINHRQKQSARELVKKESEDSLWPPDSALNAGLHKFRNM